jgi:hypothetical protein
MWAIFQRMGKIPDCNYLLKSIARGRESSSEQFFINWRNLIKTWAFGVPKQEASPCARLHVHSFVPPFDGSGKCGWISGRRTLGIILVMCWDRRHIATMVVNVLRSGQLLACMGKEQLTVLSRMVGVGWPAESAVGSPHLFSSFRSVRIRCR